MKKTGLSRRRFLRGAGSAAIGLPLLNAMGCGNEGGLELGQLSRTSTGGIPKRFVVFFSANGTIWENFRPKSGVTNSPILEPLAPYEQNIVVLDGVGMQSTRKGVGDAHQKGMAHMLSGAPLLRDRLFKGGGNSGMAGWGGGITLDQVLANRGGKTRLSSLELGVQVQSSTVWSRLSYSGPGKPLPPREDPYQVFDLLFGTASDPAKRSRKKAVLDEVLGDYSDLKNSLGAEDRRRIEEHLESISDIADRLDSGGRQCAVPSLDGGIDVGNKENYPVVGRMHMDLLVAALACDLTRVASLQWHRAVSSQVFTWLNHSVSHHEYSHKPDDDADAVARLTEINRWYAEQLAYLIQRMSETPEGDGTLLDNTCILWCNELERGNNHRRENIPWVLAGSAGGAIEGGRYLKYEERQPHNNLLVSLLNAYGHEDDTFGDPEYCTGPLDRLL